MKSRVHFVKWTRSWLKDINRELFDGPVVKTLVKELRFHKPSVVAKKNMYIYYIYIKI